MRTVCSVLIAGFLSACGPSDSMITANFLNVSDVTKISKFRSCCGHSYTVGGEGNRSMKHYLHPDPLRFGPRNDEFPIYSPFDGEIQGLYDEEHYLPCFGEIQGQQIHIVSRARPSLKLKYFHTNPIKRGRVKAGELIGYADVRGCDFNDPSQVTQNGAHSFDVALEGAFGAYSVFDYMTDDVADEWIARGLPALADAVISEAQRDANPCQQFNGPQCQADEIVF